MKGRTQTISKTLGQTRFSIPQYQRPYAWSKPQVEELFQDLESFYGSYRQKIDEGDPSVNYYLGAIVVIESDDGPLQIVDGQQRLTTILCLLRALYSFHLGYERMGYIRHAKTQAVKNAFAVPNGDHFIPHITLGGEDIQQFFSGTITAGIDTGGVKEIARYWRGDSGKLARKTKSPARRLKDTMELSYRLIKKVLQGANDGQTAASRAEKVQSIAQTLLHHCSVFQITMESEDQAYEYFEGLNDRGLALGLSDLVKNRCLANANQSGEEIRNAVHMEWEGVHEIFTGNDEIHFGLDDFLHYSWLSRRPILVRKQNLFKTFKSAGIDPTSYVDELTEDVTHLDDLFSEPGGLPTSQMIRDISCKMKVKMALLPLLAGKRAYPNGDTKWDALVQTVHTFCVRWKVIDGSQPLITSAMHKVAHMTSQGESISDIREYLCKQLPDNVFCEHLADFSGNDASFAYILLYWIEKAMQSNSGVMPLPQSHEQHLEHIMPKTPARSNWPLAKQLKDEQPMAFKKDLWRIGNLAPLPASINGALGNKTISEKMTRYSTTNLKAYDQEHLGDFLDNQSWSPKSIDDRSKHLANNWGCEAFSLA